MIRNRLYISNIDSAANIDEIVALVEKYSEGTVLKITKVDQDNKEDEHSYIVDLHDETENYLNHLNNTVTRLHDLWWKNRHIHASLII